jgi:hypothetical protein
MLFTYGRFLSRQLVNTVTSDHLLYKVVSGLIKYQMFICYFLYITGRISTFYKFVYTTFSVATTIENFTLCLKYFKVILFGFTIQF